AKKFERSIALSEDTTTVVKHNLKTKKVKINATKSGQPFKLETKVIDENSIEILNRGKGSIKLVVREDKTEPKKTVWKEGAEYALRFLMMPRSLSFRWRSSHSLNLPQFSPNVGDIFGQNAKHGPLTPGLDFAFGFYDESYVNKALERGWLLTSDEMTSPAIWNQGKEFNFELTLEPIRGLKVVLTSNLTDNRTNQVQFMFAGMPTSLSGSYTRTHVALATALKNSKASNGYESAAFTRFLENIPVIAERYDRLYTGVSYPDGGFLEGNALAGTPYNPAVGTVSRTSPDVLIPAFIAAYSGYDAHKIDLEHFQGLSSMRPNWRVTYDGLLQMGNMKNIFKSFTLSHAYQCTYSVGSYSSYLNWVRVDGNMGFTQDELSQQPIPSSPYNISSVAITEKFAPLIGVNMTFKNDLSVNAEYRDARTLNLNSSAGQIVETGSKQISVGAGMKIANFNKVVKFGSTQGGVSNDLSMNVDFAFSNNQSLIRRIETAYTQATQGTQTFSVNFMATYQMSKKVTLSAFFDHQVNTPLVSNSAYPTSNSNYGISVNISLAR
ncbi:MAG: cell surface protein SprA, partial [Muribaculaceae bacterium]|nr:cell surface protein SprA [Muribaculaceae bacterium]